MKKLLFTLVLAVGAFTFASAQQVEMDAPAKKACSKKCAKTCSKGKTAATTTTTGAAAAAKLAAMDESIDSKVCSTSGKVSYYRNSTCPVSGKATSTAVKYCSTSKAFVNVAPSQAEANGVAKKVSMDAPAKKACSKKCSKTCSKAKTTATEKTAATPQVKLVSSNQ